MSQVAELQHWLQDAILGGAAPDLRERVRGSNALTPEARLGIYSQGYRARLIECLQNEYPVLAALVGPTVFGLFAQGYVAARPSASYTLYDFGAGFAEWLDTVRPVDEPLSAMPAALARIERAKAEVARAEGVERRGYDGMDPLLAGLLGLGGWHLPDSVRLLALPFDFAETLAAVEAGQAPVPPAWTPSLVAVARANWRVDCHRLEAWQYDWLVRLPEPGPDPRLAGWIGIAVAQGIVAPIRDAARRSD